jgi:putative endonuclease
MNNKETGKFGEDIAVKYLIKNGYLILTRNHREKFDEIDIIARKRDTTLIFCEVKTIFGFSESNQIYEHFMPEDHVGSLKMKRMLRGANIFLSKYPHLIHEERGWQLDLIAITLRDNNVADIRHYENI